jgi:uncharacterized Zn finger protein
VRRLSRLIKVKRKISKGCNESLHTTWLCLENLYIPVSYHIARNVYSAKKVAPFEWNGTVGRLSSVGNELCKALPVH